MSTARITLDNPAFAGRLRDLGRGTPFAHTPVRQQHLVISDVRSRVNRQTVNVQPAKARTSRSEVLQRSITQAPQIAKTAPRQSAYSATQKLMFAMASFVFLAGVGVAFMGFRTNKHVEAQVSAVTQQSDDQEKISEDKPSDAVLGSYKVDPTLPRFIKISKLGVKARVTRQGVDKTGALKAPGNVHNAGWYENSSKPGEGGAVLLDGHVAGPTQHGVFYDIKNLVAGDLLEIERGDGTIFTYKVVKSKTAAVDKVDMSDALLSAVPGKAGLNLITCTGKYNAQKGSYDQRIIVFAVQQ